MDARSAVLAVSILLIVIAVDRFFRLPVGRRVGKFAPEPFWIYFLSILLGITGLAPRQSPVYAFSSNFVLPAAIFLMLVGSPVTALLRLGRSASAAMVLAAGTMWIAMIACHAVFARWLPPDSWKGAGALLGTWIGGSANMVAVKEVLGMPDTDLAPLIIVDTILSYTWLALLLLGPAFQRRFDAGAAEETAPAFEERSGPAYPRWLPILAAAAVALACGWIGRRIGAAVTAIPSSGWTLLVATLVAILAALTPLRGLEAAGASKQGGIALYVVLASIGARTELQSAASAPIYIAFGAAVLLLHGGLLLGAARMLRIPLYLASTASQANVGGAVSAPIVAEAYRPGTASVGVLMAVAGALLGTWAGVAGGLVCRTIATWLK
jgi:uncharacterized membrane protein